MTTEIDSTLPTQSKPQAPALDLASGSPLRLFRVQLERTLYVLAKDAREAEHIGERNEREECGNDLDFCHATPATDLAKVPVEWRDSLPYAPWGHKEEKTVEQLLENNEIRDARSAFSVSSGCASDKNAK